MVSEAKPKSDRGGECPSLTAFAEPYVLVRPQSHLDKLLVLAYFTVQSPYEVVGRQR